MAEFKFTAALTAAQIPLVSAFQARSVIIGGIDNRLIPANAKVKDSEVDNNPQNLPQVMYVENVMPTNEGLISVAFDNIEAQVGGETLFDELHILRDEYNNIKYYSPARGRNYVTTGAGWVSTNPLAGIPVNAQVSLAYVNGVTFVCYSGTKLLQWDGAAFVDVSASLVGVAIADVVAITGSINYLVLLTSDLSVKWSSLVDPLDFVPDETTGAGSQIPADVRGAPVCLTSVTGGFIIHCSQNAVAAAYTNNSAQPWIFREIKNAGGVDSNRQVSSDNTSGAVYQWGKSGFQSLSLREADNMFPAVSSFLAGLILEEFDGATNTLSITRLASNLFVKVAYVAGRYIVLSYGETDGTYDYALIFDNGLKRWGKVKREHVDIASGYSAALQSLWLLKNTGAVEQIAIDWRDGITGAGVIILGRYQVSRTHQICSQQLDVECLDSDDSLSVLVAPSYNGGTVGQVLAMVEATALNSGRYRVFQKQVEGENLSFILKGSFSISTVLIIATKGAKS